MNSWIEIRQFPAEQDLTPLVVFLNERRIEHRISEISGKQSLSVRHPEMVQPITELINSLERGEFQLQALEGETHHQQVPSTTIPLLVQMRHFPVVFVLLLACTLGFVVATYAQDWLRYFTFQDFNSRYYIPLDVSLQAGEYWRLITPTFLHFGVMHFLFNGVLLWWFGQRLEVRFGHLEFILLFLCASIAANVGQYWWAGAANFGGISGVIYAFVGFVLVLKFSVPQLVHDIQLSLLWFMLGWLVLCMTGIVDMFMAGGGVANAAHVAGLVAGLIYGFIRVMLIRARKQ